eukprot:423625-Amphidinium_carterae.2
MPKLPSTTIFEYETIYKTKVSDDIKIASVVNSAKGQLRNHLLLNMDETTTFEDVNKTISDFFQSNQPIDQINGFKGKKGKKREGKSKGPPIKGKSKGRAFSKGSKGKNRQNQLQQWGQNHQYQGFYQAKEVSNHMLDLWQARPHIQSVLLQGPVYQLDATDSVEPPMPIELGAFMQDQSNSQPAQISGRVSGLWYPGPIISDVIGAIMDINQRSEDDSCCKIISQSDVRRCGQKWSPVYDSGAAVSVAPLSFAPHVPLQTIRGSQKLQSVTDADIMIHGFKKCTIMSGGIGLRVNFSICDVSGPIISNSTMKEN